MAITQYSMTREGLVLRALRNFGVPDGCDDKLSVITIEGPTMVIQEGVDPFNHTPESSKNRKRIVEAMQEAGFEPRVSSGLCFDLNQGKNDSKCFESLLRNSERYAMTTALQKLAKQVDFTDTGRQQLFLEVVEKELGIATGSKSHGGEVLGRRKPTHVTEAQSML